MLLPLVPLAWWWQQEPSEWAPEQLAIAQARVEASALLQDFHEAKKRPPASPEELSAFAQAPKRPYLLPIVTKPGQAPAWWWRDGEASSGPWLDVVGFPSPPPSPQP